ncbi:MAG: STAS domain-containing protein [Elusimicrobia bacterium]|nr:STAS domain-containing protein [Elusimicrobiota bacterium]
MVKITIEDITGSNIKRLIVTGVMDNADNNEFTKSVQEEIKKGNYYFIADMTRVLYINSSGILDLLCSKEQLQKYKGGVKFYGFSRNLYDILEALGLLKMIEVYDNFEECQKAIYSLLPG